MRFDFHDRNQISVIHGRVEFIDGHAIKVVLEVGFVQNGVACFEFEIMLSKPLEFCFLMDLRSYKVLVI